MLADENQGAEGDAILQPGTADGGRDPEDAVAKLGRFVALDDSAPNIVDAALAVVDEGVEVTDGTVTGVGQVGGEPVAPADAGAVEKLGRTTGHTTGRVTAFELDNVVVAYGAFPSLRFDNQIEVGSTGTGPFSQGGDSGSLIFEAGSLRPVGLLFAGGTAAGVDHTYANPIAAVLTALEVTLR